MSPLGHVRLEVRKLLDDPEIQRSMGKLDWKMAADALGEGGDPARLAPAEAIPRDLLPT